MMKKIIVMVLVMFATVSFAKAVKGFMINHTEKQIDEYIAIQKADNDNYRLAIGYGFKSLVGKNDSNISYSDMKKIVFDSMNDIKITNVQKNNISSVVIYYSVMFNNNFKNFRENFIRDKGFCKSVNHFLNVLFTLNNANDYRLFINSDFVNKLNAEQLMKFSRNYEQIRFSFTKEEQIQDLSKLKMIYYPKIAESDSWKSALVKIELILKSVQ